MAAIPWIKVEHNTPEKDEVRSISRATGLDRDAVLGKLIRVWVWFDMHTTDGVAARLVDADVDDIAGFAGFSKAMRDAEWIDTPEGGGLRAVEFDKHNGCTAKQRAMGRAKKDNQRSGVVPKVRGQDLISYSYSSSFIRFWDAWPAGHPRKVNKPKCYEVWQRAGCEALVDHIVAHVTQLKGSEQWREQNGKYIPGPLVYLNQQRWDGAVVSTAPKSIFNAKSV